VRLVFPAARIVGAPGIPLTTGTVPEEKEKS